METGTSLFLVASHDHPACEGGPLCQIIMQDIQILIQVHFYQMEEDGRWKNSVWPNHLTSSLALIKPSCPLPNLFMTFGNINSFFLSS